LLNILEGFSCVVGGFWGSALTITDPEGKLIVRSGSEPGFAKIPHEKRALLKPSEKHAVALGGDCSSRREGQAGEEPAGFFDSPQSKLF